MTTQMQSLLDTKQYKMACYHLFCYLAVLLGSFSIGCVQKTKESESRDRLIAKGVMFYETRRATPFVNIPAADDGHLLVMVPCNDGSDINKAWGDEEVLTTIHDFQNLPDLNYLMLRLTRISDRSMSDIGTLQSLRHINLSSTGVTDEGLARLNSLAQLEGLYAENSETITGRGLESLKSLPLRKLSLRATVATDASLAVLSEFTTLEHLDLGLNDGVGDRTLAVVAKLPNLKTLLLDRTSVTDKGLSELVQCQRLERLELGFCVEIRDADLIQQLCGLPNLLELGLSGTGIEEMTIRELRKKFPRVEIKWTFGEQK